MAARVAFSALWLGASAMTVVGQPTSGPGTRAELPADLDQARALLAKLDASFGAEFTPSFTIVSDVKAPIVKTLAGLAESTLQDVGAFAERLDLTVSSPRTKMTVLLFDHWKDYSQHASEAGLRVDESVPGLFDQRSGLCIMFNYANSAAVAAKRDEIARARRALQEADDPERMRHRVEGMEVRLAQHEELINTTVFRHELAHQALFAFGLQTPATKDRRWLCEGLAMQFECAQGVNRYRLADFLAIRRKQGGISLRSLVADPKLLGPGAADSASAYAAAWALVCYLTVERPAAFSRYLRALNETVALAASSEDREIALFEAAFGRIDSAFESRWRAYIQSLVDR